MSLFKSMHLINRPNIKKSWRTIVSYGMLFGSLRQVLIDAVLLGDKGILNNFPEKPFKFGYFIVQNIQILFGNLKYNSVFQCTYKKVGR